MTITRSATSRANCISWVTTIIVMPSWAERRIDLQDFAHQLGIERRRHFVEEHGLGLHRQRARDCHALLLAARELMRGALLPCRQGRFGCEQFDGARPRLSAGEASHVDRGLR